MGLQTTADFIARHAQAQPGALAVLDHGRPVTRQQLKQDLAQACHVLQKLGASAGTVVALICPNAYQHWLLVLACEQLGAVSDGLLDLQHEAWATLHQRADLLVTTVAMPATPACVTHLLAPEWLQPPAAGVPQPAPATPALPVNAAARVARSSGTTGTPRRMLLTRQALDHRVRSWVALLQLHEHSRYLLTLQLAASTACYQAHACARSGAVLVLAPAVNAWQAVAQYGVTHLFCLPGLLGQWLGTLPTAWHPPPALHVFCGGASLPPALRQDALARLATAVTEVYASNEAGVTASSDGEPGTGLRLRPGCDAEVVDEQGQPLPRGQTGHIRLRTPGMVHGYLDGHDHQPHFRDGWFYPGDIGTVPDPQHLYVAGRATDVMNLGGVKLLPQTIEAQLVSDQVPAHELAVCSLPDARGLEEVWVALCGQAAAHQDQVLKALEPVCQELWWVRFRVVQLDSVNPQAPAKLSRRALRETLAGLASGAHAPA